MNNAFTQGDKNTVETNDTGLVNSTGMTNTTLAFAQEGFQTEDLVNETIDIGNNTATANAILVYTTEHWSKKVEEYREMREHIGKKFENIGKSTTTMNTNSPTIMNSILLMSIIGNDTAKP
jgi:hypothetical protein